MCDKNLNGAIYVIGTGPGHPDYMSLHAIKCIAKCDTVVGYKTYIKQIEPLLVSKKVVVSGMRHELERCQQAVDLAMKGSVVAVISSGDAGIYGMAGVILELVAKQCPLLPVEIVPGITSAVSSASIAGAPLMNDFAVISLSDLMTPWHVIEKRIEAAAMGDFVIALYNPKSKERITQIEVFQSILLKHRPPQTPVAIVHNAMRDKQQLLLTTLIQMLEHPIDMTTTILIGNSQTVIANGRMITPRGYKL
jgi:precorrin-3B C17-methyltransferase